MILYIKKISGITADAEIGAAIFSVGEKLKANDSAVLNCFVESDVGRANDFGRANIATFLISKSEHEETVSFVRIEGRNI